ncbi:ornithine decarboxylase antizyme-domain-containing protein [Bisporella sp. PMI_857]|nr:ornithine decarboxylase antizyme-domain-containing protein [Bisporella sp. PMI_857]
MSPSKKSNQSSSSNRRGGNVDKVLASCYIVDTSLNLTGFHYSTTGAGGNGIPEARQNLWESPPSSPPLAALTSANELALVSKNPNRKRESNGRSSSRKEGAAYTIRVECERLFCETMKTIFFGEERSMGSTGSIGMDTNTHSSLDTSMDVYNKCPDTSSHGHGVDASLEIWDYAGGCSFRGFVGGLGEKKSLFAFFDPSVIGRDLKKGLMALLELADTVFAVQQAIICLSRSIPEAESKAFIKSLGWVGFELITLEMWSGDMDLTSDKWIFLGMEV